MQARRTAPVLLCALWMGSCPAAFAAPSARPAAGDLLALAESPGSLAPDPALTPEQESARAAEGYHAGLVWGRAQGMAEQFDAVSGDAAVLDEKYDFAPLMVKFPATPELLARHPKAWSQGGLAMAAPPVVGRLREPGSADPAEPSGEGAQGDAPARERAEADAAPRVLERARLIEARADGSPEVPTWRSYFPGLDTARAQAAALPRPRPAPGLGREAWLSGFQEGMAKGLYDARQLVEAEASLLMRDHQGMAAYRKLDLQGVAQELARSF